MTAQLVQNIALLMPALLLSLSVHEFAHAWMATRLGDPTPERQGRLTLSPASHVDPVGTLLFPLGLLVFTGGIFGWARPVQFNPANFSRGVSMRRGAAVTALVGPLSNVFLALVSLIAMRVLLQVDARPDLQRMLTKFFSGMFQLNVLLAVFNILPLPPLDGSHLLPRSMDGFKEAIAPYSFIVFMLVFFIPLPGLNRPLGSWILEPIMSLLASSLNVLARLEF